MFNVGSNFLDSDLFHSHVPNVTGTIPALPETVIGHDVYIGHGAFIRPGTKIGHGAIVAAHSVVVKDVPPYAVVAGNPAVVRKFRIPTELIEPFLAVEWWRFAPWQIKGIDTSQPAAALTWLERLGPKLVPYTPAKISICDLI
jgi:hypothetical protein